MSTQCLSGTENLHRRTNLFQCLHDPYKVRSRVVKRNIHRLRRSCSGHGRILYLIWAASIHRTLFFSLSLFILLYFCLVNGCTVTDDLRDAVVFRASEANGYAFLPRPLLMSFIAVSAYVHPATETNAAGETILSTLFHMCRQE
jgi:hypothetical protein